VSTLEITLAVGGYSLTGFVAAIGAAALSTYMFRRNGVNQSPDKVLGDAAIVGVVWPLAAVAGLAWGVWILTGKKLVAYADKKGRIDCERRENALRLQRLRSEELRLAERELDGR
jgi:hypothetical protein